MGAFSSELDKYGQWLAADKETDRDREKRKFLRSVVMSPGHRREGPLNMYYVKWIVTRGK